MRLGPGAPAAEGQQARADDPMAEIIASVRAQEARYQDIEYVVKITTRQADPRAPDRPAEVKSIETRRVVLQGDRIYLRKEVHERVLASRVAREEISAYDGEWTRTVVAGNCANIHLGRFEHPDVSLPHVLALAHDHVNFPLSAYLAGTEAIHAHSKYPRFNGESGSVHEFTIVETDYEGEEVVDGLRGAKIRVNRWYLSRDEPWLQYLWQARERNFFCVKEQVSWPKFGDVVLHEMRVDRMQEVAPGLWFPMKLTVIDYDADATKLTKKPVVSSRTETVVEKIDLAPHHDDAFFRDVAIPADLPVFTIRDRTLVGSTLPEPVGGGQTRRGRRPGRRAGEALSRSRGRGPRRLQVSRRGYPRGGDCYRVYKSGAFHPANAAGGLQLTVEFQHAGREAPGDASDRGLRRLMDAVAFALPVEGDEPGLDHPAQGEYGQDPGASRRRSGASPPRPDAARRRDPRPPGRPADLTLVRPDQQVSASIPVLRRGEC